MITYKEGDIFKEEADAIVNTVNCVGVMGAALRCSSKSGFLRISKYMQRPANKRKSGRVKCLCMKPTR